MEKKLREFCLKERLPVLWHAPLSDFTSFRIGGLADAFLLPDTEKALLSILCFLKHEKIPHRIIGNGTNLLFSDDGFRGAIVSTRHVRGVTVVGKTARAAAGTPLNVLCRTLAEHSLDGFSSLYGIPGTVGGAVFMNAGAFNATVSEFLDFVSVYNVATGRTETLSKKEIGFSYRSSIFQARRNIIILSAEFSLPKGEEENIREKMRQNIEKRMEAQPLALPCAGSTFLRPKDGYAAAWIEKAGLKGARIGGAAVSLKHAGFIVNLGDATAKDVLSLIAMIKDEVNRRFGIVLVPEIEYID
ncbi:MAG: UDP-N-acetylmuramate dehydrogenase [Ruminococcaceae bacterium]|nr:UDP-N-acetylmuramate dehydrogenase [Oscillospiraceae bacterium]